MAESFPSLHLIRHALAQHKLTYMRDAACTISRFRQLVREVGMMLTMEITRDFPTGRAQLEVTNLPGELISGNVLAGNNAVVVPLLRAGLTLAEGAVEVMPGARIGHIGLYRDSKTNEVSEYLVALPNPKGRMFILMDAVIGSGHTASHAISILKDKRIGVADSHIRFASIITTPEGMRKVSEDHPNVRVYALSLDERLDDKGHIIPGLGSVSARLFGTVA